MPNCNFNSCFSGNSYPRQIFTRRCKTGSCSGGRIVNPDVPVQFAVFTLNTATSVESGEVVPVTRTSFGGTAISDGGNGKIDLTAGVYRISYNATAVMANGGEVRTILEFDGVAVSTTESVLSGSAGEETSLSNQIILNLEEAGTLTLVNSASESVNILTANVSIDKL